MIHLRRISQVIFLVLFIYLLLYPSPLQSILPVNLFFISNPLLALTTILASKDFQLAFIAAGIILLITIFLGRVFCGWLCPLGTTMDIFHRFKKKNIRNMGNNSLLSNLRQVKYFVLLVIIIVAIFGVNIAGWFDPITIVFKSFALSLYPAIDYLLKEVIDTLGLKVAFNPLNNIGILDNNNLLFHNSIIFLLILAVILLITFYQSRFWCRNFCPLGALLVIFSKWRFLNLNLNKDLCGECNRCCDVCKTKVFNPDLSIVSDECIQCFTCVKECSKGGISLGFSKEPTERVPVLPSRRGLLIASGLSILSVPLLMAPTVPGLKRCLYLPLLRPPGASRSEDKFLSKCLRCGECMKVCPTNGLQPLLTENGLYGMFSPVLVPRIGDCSFYCNTCGQVCPAGAIPPMELADKQEWKIGAAFIDTNRCIPYTDNKDCITCEEYCPVPHKAIEHYEKDGLKYPYVMKDRCIGCGVCEKVCPVAGIAAIRISPIQ